MPSKVIFEDGTTYENKYTKEKVISEERREEKKKSILAYKRYLNNQKQIEEKNNVKKLELRR